MWPGGRDGERSTGRGLCRGLGGLAGAHGPQREEAEEQPGPTAVVPLACAPREPPAAVGRQGGLRPSPHTGGPGKNTHMGASISSGCSLPSRSVTSIRVVMAASRTLRGQGGPAGTASR